MPAYKKIGPCTAIVAPGFPASGDKPGCSATYRNIAAVDELPTTLDGATTLFEAFESSAAKYADRPCLGWRPIGEDGSPGSYQFLTYKETHIKARNLASALAGSGVSKGNKVGIYSANNVQWMLTIRAADTLAATIVPIYDSLGDAAVEYIIKHSELTVAIVEPSKLESFASVAPAVASQVKLVVTTADPLEQGQKAAAEAIRKAGIELISFDDYLEAGEKAPVEPTPPTADDVACIMYTSGTTGKPKGVMVSHRNLVAAVAGSKIMLNQCGMKFGPGDLNCSYLTLAHVYGREMEELMLHLGIAIGYWRGNVKLLMDDVAALRPTLFIAVPRILERVCDAVESKVAKGPAAARIAFSAAFNYKLFLLRQGLSHGVSGFGVDQIIFKKVRQALGGRVRYIVSGGAPLAAHVEDFCNVCMAPLLQGYGLTETCAASFIMLPDPRMAHTVGPPLAPTEFRFESVPELKYDAVADPPKGEICIRSPMLFAGYYKDPEKTAAEFDADGFFHTGDIGTLTPEGCLKIIDRKKNIFKLAQGEYIAVEYLESKLSRNENVEQIWVYGNSFESSVVAVVVPKAHWLEKFSGGAEDPEAKKAMLEELTNTGKAAKLKGFEMVKAVHLEPEQFSVENDLMTPSMKVKRPQLLTRYQKDIDAMYAALKTR